MPTIQFACPKCGERVSADVPSEGARVVCTACGAGVRAKPPAPKPAPKPAFEVVDDAPAAPAEPVLPAKPRKKARVVAIEEDDDEPRSAKPNKGKKARSGPPVWALVGGGVALLAVIGTVVALALSGDGDKQAQVPPPAVPNVQPARPDPPKVEPPKVNPPKVDPPKVDPPQPNLPKVDPPAPDGNIDDDWPALPPRKRPREGAGAPSRTTVRWYAPPAGRAPVVVLEMPRDPFLGGPAHRGPLARELCRQAVSLAARDEFGATTRDAVLNEPPGDLGKYAPAGTFELTWLAVPGKAATAALASIAGDERRELWRAEVPLPDADAIDYARLATALEAAARGPLAEALAKATGAARRAAPVAPVAPRAEVEGALKSASYFDAFDAVRRLHAAGAGGVPATCTDLARGYAHLALLTRHLNRPSDRTFKARALLYAHRAAARGAPAGAWAVAYVSAVSGAHARALVQAKAAEGAERPDWAKVVHPVCAFDSAALHALAKEPGVGAIGGVLAFVAADNFVVYGNQIQLGTEVAMGHPDCFLVTDRVARLAVLGLGRAFTESAAPRISDALGRHLARWPDLPAAAGAFDRVRARDADADRKLLRALDDADGPSEPALGALAALVRFERADSVDAYHFMAETSLGVPALAKAHTLRELPFLEGHPDYDLYARVLEQPNGPPRPVDARGVSEELLYGQTAFAAADPARADDTEDDLRWRAMRAVRDTPAGAKELIARLLRAAPESPHARALLVVHDWPTVAGEAAVWEKRFAARADVLAALGRKYHETMRHDDAERALLAAAKLSADNTTYQRLATIYTEVRKDEAKALAVMKERLTRPDYGLECSRMRIRIAAIYARNKDLRTALSYAERAAEDSGAAWAMSPTIAYANQLGDREKARLWSARLRERYGP